MNTEKRWLDSADPGKGRLRTFLIVMLKKFMSNEWRRAYCAFLWRFERTPLSSK